LLFFQIYGISRNILPFMKQVKGDFDAAYSGKGVSNPAEEVAVSGGGALSFAGRALNDLET